jgi:hypothetical protein
VILDHERQPVGQNLHHGRPRLEGAALEGVVFAAHPGIKASSDIARTTCLRTAIIGMDLTSRSTEGRQPTAPFSLPAPRSPPHHISRVIRL